jgi:glc operon protein GlcG
MSLDAAKKAMAASEAEANKNNWPVAIAILDTTGSLVMLQKLDNTQTGSVEIAIGKARTALDFRRPSKALQDVVAGGGAGLRLLSVRNMLALEGGVPVIVDGKVVGAVRRVGRDVRTGRAGCDGWGSSGKVAPQADGLGRHLPQPASIPFEFGRGEENPPAAVPHPCHRWGRK